MGEESKSGDAHVHQQRGALSLAMTAATVLVMASNSPQHQTAPVGTCLFCGASGPLTDEHIYGKWLRKLGYKGGGVREIVPGDGSQPIIQQGGPFTKALKIVCYPCNNEWMSGMEEEAKPLLIAMFNAQGSVRLDQAAQVTLARWAFKTAAVAAQVDRSDPFPLEHRGEFHQADRPPGQVQIRIGRASIPTLALGEQLAEYRFEPRTATITSAGRSTSIPFYRATFRLLTVVFDILGYVAPTDLLNIDPSDDLKKALLPLWPWEHPNIWWPPVTNLDVIGGVPGLAGTELIGAPIIIPGGHT